MLLAAQISVYSEDDPTNMRWATVPNIRELADLDTLPSLEVVQRPAWRGSVVSVEADAVDCRAHLTPSHRVVNALFAGSQWKFDQSDNGIFATRLGAMLGGMRATIPNEPAAREVLTKVVRSRRGKPLNEVASIARAARGQWPGKVAGDDEIRRYPSVVVTRLLRDKIMRPELSLRCPECALVMSIRPEDLRTDITCAMCSATYPLGFALSLAKSQHAWHYRTSPDLSEEELLEAIATLATRSTLNRWHHIGTSTSHMLGVRLTDRSATDDDESCEIDIMFLFGNGGRPAVIVGEVKSTGRLQAADVRNLQSVQRWFRSQGIECWILFATLRDSLNDSEMELLRKACDEADRTLGSVVEPVFPIVLLRPELSASFMDDASIEGWHAGKTGLAVSAAQRNLGLVSYTWVPGGNPQWSCVWSGQ